MIVDFDSLSLASPFYNESHRQWRDVVRKFVAKEISPYIDDWEEQGEVPLTLWPKAAGIGLLQLGYAEDYGGVSDGIDAFHQVIASEELAQCGATGITASLTVHGIALPPVQNFGSEELKRAVIPPVLNGEKRISLGVTEASGGSDVAALKTTAKKQGDVYIVNGSKTFISGGMRANWLTTAVRTGGQGAGGISLLLIPMDADGVSRTKLDKKQGWWCSDTATIYFEDVEVPVANLIGAENQGFVPIVSNFNSERLGIASLALASAKVCFQEAAEWASERRTFGKTLAKHQVIRHKFAEMYKRINATQAYRDICAWQQSQGTLKVQAVSMLKVQATETMEFCAREAMQILGGIGYMRECKTERLYREVRVLAIGGGSEEIMRDLTASQLGL